MEIGVDEGEDDMENKVSIIVPVYNTKQYIRGCVKSVLKQTYANWELILIDDGSSDGSREICRALCEKDKRIRFISQEHKGVSVARNAGLDLAQGESVFFLDSDDLIHPQLLEIFYKVQKENQSAVVTCGLYNAPEGKFCKPEEWRIEKNGEQQNVYLCNEKAIRYPFFTHIKTMLRAIGGKMILRKAIEEIRFDERLTHGEDSWFMFQVLIRGADVSVLYRDWYYYRRYGKSTGKIYSVDTCTSRYKVEKYICNFYIKTGRIPDAKCIEWTLLTEMIIWYEIGRRENNIKLIRYMDNLIEHEKREWIFSQLCQYQKIIFYLGRNFYNAYKYIIKTIEYYYKISDKFFELINNSIL